jgi:tetratricopeptide repeat protein 21B
MKAADSYLKQAFAQDFSIRENPVFMLMKSEVELKQKNWQEALQTLEHVMKLPIVQDPTSVQEDQKARQNRFTLPFGQEERARIFLNLVHVYCEMNSFDQAKKILTRAISEFTGTPEEVRVMLAQSDLSMKMGDTKKALNMLKKIQPGDVSFVQAKKKQAQIYLDELKDRNNYTRCYLEILDAKSSVENFKMVAGALMDI